MYSRRHQRKHYHVLLARMPHCLHLTKAETLFLNKIRISTLFTTFNEVKNKIKVNSTEKPGYSLSLLIGEPLFRLQRAAFGLKSKS